VAACASVSIARYWSINRVPKAVKGGAANLARRSRRRSGDRPGKIRLLEAIRDTGSITQAGRALGMSYRRAWLLVDDMNNCFREPVIAAQAGGAHGGGATPGCVEM
jgi:molybdenum-dependent DNA-binding transcriptional regulator ModE